MADLEKALIDHLQHFLLERGRGFSFVARQKREHRFGIRMIFLFTITTTHKVIHLVESEYIEVCINV
ncbi:PDDEXK nuclease domain-containing protein [Catenibacterium sp.]|uniref:PDDEXK nuclease domain-containing protein n=1 Tax=Catenibacterium sp. TaxID=2049022 RepID=UPI002E76B77F|nr:PDDEXK nuclease domain-containing protein [Catenibacterium sp.]MEE0491918.1 PDDEXK nuclease domain-containing protein [Catenibacterium sp.]